MTVRLRLTLTAVLVVGTALVAGSFVLVALLSSALTEQVCSAARARAVEVATAPAAVRGRPTSASSFEIVQLVDRSGAVVGADGIGSMDPGDDCRAIEPPGYGEDFAFVAAAVDDPGGDGPVRVIVGRPLVDVLDSTRFLTRVLLVGLPVVLLVVGATTWIVAGQALAPVAAIRREVDAISAAELHRRVPAVRTRDEVGRLAATMNRMLDRLEQAQASQRRFVSDASHELRSPISSIRQHVEVALAHPDRTTLGELAGTVLAEDLRIQRLVDDLLLLAKADERALRLPRAPVDLDDLVFATAKRLRETTRLRIDTSAVSAGRVVGDETALRRVVDNLGENAARWARTKVAFALTERGGDVVLRVSDDGPGVPPGERERIFERFVRLSDARARADGGSGLGLAIVAELTRAHGGSVRVSDDVLGGAGFEIHLTALAG
ncbi:MAG TPA: HAMP domain-containing sensor histidine kinase [Kribbella sp.]|nr:HAMP domain-containing sensor histidine kinase [Kribbella sp.]